MTGLDEPLTRDNKLTLGACLLDDTVNGPSFCLRVWRLITDVVVRVDPVFL